MNLYDRVTAEYETISKSDFWKLYMDRIREYRGVLSRKCETDENPAKSQGGVASVDFILGKNDQLPLAERLLAELKKKSQ